MHLHLPSHLASAGTSFGRAERSRLQELDSFGTNRGNLKAWYFAPEVSDGEDPPLVVVLHGCSQTAHGYDRGSGWSELAHAFGFAVLFPEQQRANNPNLCFNWFEPGHTRRGAGEASSIVQMVEAMVARHGIDPQRVFITGLSAGGAMTSVMLATYPEVFAGGAILAGLPHGAAASVQEAFQQMRAPSPNGRTTGRSILASGHQGRWPSVAIWHGTADTVVSPSNAEAIVRQWTEVHGLPAGPTEHDVVDGYPHRTWRDGAGKLLVEEYKVTGMGHGTPLATAGECGCGEAGAFMLEVGISSTVHSARTWGLLGERRAVAAPDTSGHSARLPSTEAGRGEHAFARAGASAPLPSEEGIANVINAALRAAGLMK